MLNTLYQTKDIFYIDVDLYRPTKQILDIVKDRVTKGSIICFDEGNNKDFPGEQKALNEFLKQYPSEYEGYIELWKLMYNIDISKTQKNVVDEIINYINGNSNFIN